MVQYFWVITMKYPVFLKGNNTIGIVATSLGATKDPYKTRYLSFKSKFKELGYNIVESKLVHRHKKGESGTAIERAEEFMRMYKNPDIDFIMSSGGGELMCEILPYIDFEELKKYPPKYFMGYSDNTNLTFTLTTHLDIATIYGDHAPTFGMNPWHRQVKDAYKIMCGKKFTQVKYGRYQDKNDKNNDNPLAPIHGTKVITWKNLENRKKVRLEGRLLGGCLDCLINLVGTPFDNVKEYTEKYKDDGIIFYLEACDLNVFGIRRALWQLKQAGWFTYCKGIIFGRAVHDEKIMNLSLKDTLEKSLSDLNVPVIYDFDFGHVEPRMTLINGSYVQVEYNNGDGKLKMILK